MINPNSLRQTLHSELLSNKILPLKYHLLIQPDIEKMSFQGTASININILEPTEEITLHSVDLSLILVEVHISKNEVLTPTIIIPNKEKETGWMVIDKPNKLRIEYKGDNDLIIISNSAYLILYKAEDDIITSLPNEGPWSILTKNDLQLSSNKNDPDADGIINNIKVEGDSILLNWAFENLIKNSLESISNNKKGIIDITYKIEQNQIHLFWIVFLKH